MRSQAELSSKSPPNTLDSASMECGGMRNCATCRSLLDSSSMLEKTADIGFLIKHDRKATVKHCHCTNLCKRGAQAGDKPRFKFKSMHKQNSMDQQ